MFSLNYVINEKLILGSVEEQQILKFSSCEADFMKEWVYISYKLNY